MQQLLTAIMSFFVVILAPFQPSANQLYQNKNTPVITQAPVYISPPVKNASPTNIPIITIAPITNSNSKSAIVDFKDLAAKQKEIDEYKKTDACYISFVKSNYKICPQGCAYQAEIQPDPESSAPVSFAKCGTRADYLPFY